jgi:hypothetical protein
MLKILTSSSVDPGTRTYQLDLTTPGISPLRAKVLKQIRHIWNLLRNALGLPQRGQRL